ncbi:hypothetical protein GCM10009021_19800 [Halarchaeum nitratireducens]|uniref:Uncharacterized protein n=1 Tax=Halarchaeum nitratireducens TaxID=489913 RepID=A0A830GCH3_9EURY|nr:hypothetical protein GCM10009021_19800 [Halarchaeum nitratireducens]
MNADVIADPVAATNIYGYVVVARRYVSFTKGRKKKSFGVLSNCSKSLTDIDQATKSSVVVGSIL